jgi:hypothetical protein
MVYFRVSFRYPGGEESLSGFCNLYFPFILNKLSLIGRARKPGGDPLAGRVVGGGRGVTCHWGLFDQVHTLPLLF